MSYMMKKWFKKSASGTGYHTKKGTNASPLFVTSKLYCVFGQSSQLSSDHETSDTGSSKSSKLADTGSSGRIDRGD